MDMVHGQKVRSVFGPGHVFRGTREMLVDRVVERGMDRPEADATITELVRERVISVRGAGLGFYRWRETVWQQYAASHANLTPAA